MKRLLLAATVMALAGPASAHGPFDGMWTVEPAWCANDPIYTHESPLMIDLPTVRAYDGDCEIDAFERIGEAGDAWGATLICTGDDGVRRETQEVFAVDRGPDGDMRGLIRIGLGDGRVTVYSLCP